MALQLIGLNNATAPVAIRERLYFGGHALPAFLQTLIALPGIDACVVLSTCNRTEIMLSGTNEADVIQLLVAHTQISSTELHPHLYRHMDIDAVAHLFRVACGLDSLMIGETQILRQIRDALDTARECDTAGRKLNLIFEHAIAMGKRARSETAISAGAFSIGRAGVEFARMVFGNLKDSPVLVLGAGKISELTAKHLAANDVQSIFVANRTYERAKELAHRLGGQSIHYHQLAEFLTEVDILLSSTSAPHYVLHVPEVAKAISDRGGRPLCLIDLAVPRDIDPAVADIPGVHLYNIDDLHGVAENDAQRRLSEIPKVEAIICHEVERCANRLAGLDASTVIMALRKSFEQTRQTELQRAIVMMSNLNQDQQKAVELMTASMINKLLHTPTVRLKELIAAEPERNPHQLLCKMFALHEYVAEEMLADE